MPTARRLALVPLEVRETPATLVDAATLTYRDVDGDSVVVKFTKPILDDLATVAAVFTFAPGPVLGGEQLRSINLTGLTAQQVKGIGITVTATRSLVNGGDGFAAVGTINATGADIGDVIIDGDLGDVHAGDAKYKTSCVGLLKVNSIGRYGTSTGGTLVSNLVGKVGSIAVKTSVVGASVQIAGDPDSKLGALTVGGSLVGGVGNRSGAVTVTGDIGLVVIGGNLVGGAGVESGSVVSTSGGMGNVTVRGSLVGGAGERSGAVIADDGGMGIVKVFGDLRGDGLRSGTLRATAGATSVLVGGSLVGGADESGAVRFGGKVGPVTVRHDVAGGVGPGSASIRSGAALGKVTVFGSLVGGDGMDSAQVSSVDDLGGLFVGGSLRGGAGDRSARVLAGGRLLSLTVGGSLVGGQGTALDAACVRAGKDIGPILIKGSIDGSVRPVTISAVGHPNPLTTDVAIRSFSVRGDVVGATVLAGYDTSSQPVNADAQVGPVSVLGDWTTSILAAGVTAGGDGVFGTGDDAVIAEAGQLAAVSARIASVRVGGQATGTGSAGDGYGFFAQTVGAFNLGGVAVPMRAGIANDSLVFGSTLDVYLREV